MIENMRLECSKSIRGLHDRLFAKGLPDFSELRADLAIIASQLNEFEALVKGSCRELSVAEVLND
jgi:hypothetical protein